MIVGWYTGEVSEKKTVVFGEAAYVWIPELNRTLTISAPMGGQFSVGQKIRVFVENARHIADFRAIADDKKHCCGKSLKTSRDRVQHNSVFHQGKI